MQTIGATVVLALLAAALFPVARPFGYRLLGEPARPEYRAAAILNAVVLAAAFLFVVLGGLGAAGIPAAIAGVIVGVEVSLIVTYAIVRFVFGQGAPRPR